MIKIWRITLQQAAQKQSNNLIIFIKKLVSLGGRWKENQIYKNNNQTICLKKIVKNKKKTQNVEEMQPTPTKNKNHHTEESKYIQPKQTKLKLFNLSNTTLSKCQTRIFLRGLKFNSTTKSKSTQLTYDLRHLHKLKTIRNTTLRQLTKKWVYSKR